MRPRYGLDSRISVGSKNFPVLQKVHTGFGAHSASNLMYAGALSWDLNGRVVRLNCHYHLVLRLGMSAALIVNDDQQDATILTYLFIPNQLYMFRAMSSPIVRSI